jgi:hypothetical protein
MKALNKGEGAMTAQCMYRSIVVVLLALGLATSGCATTPPGGADTPAAASIAAQSSPLAGTWNGSSYGIGAGSKSYSAILSVRFEEDGSWRAVETQSTRTREFSGTSSVRDNQVLLTESTGHYFLKLRLRGNRMYGLYPSAPDYTYPGPMKLEFTRAE